MTVVDQQLAGQPDVCVAQLCQAAGRALVTLDLIPAIIRNHASISLAFKARMKRTWLGGAYLLPLERLRQPPLAV
jgi:hypothetical protein